MVFFFQAEDGIRDWSVTGVQTCALPICRGRHQVRSAAQRRRAARRRERARYDNALGVRDPVAGVYATGERNEVIGDTLLEALVLPLQSERKASETADQADANRPPREHKRPPRRIVKNSDAIVTRAGSRTYWTMVSVDTMLRVIMPSAPEPRAASGAA